MIFTPPACMTTSDPGPASTKLIGDFILEGQNAGSQEKVHNGACLIDAITREKMARERMIADTRALSAGLASELGWETEATDNDRVVAFLSENTIQYMVHCWAFQRLGATCLLLHTTNTPLENARLMRLARCNVIVSSPGQMHACQKTIKSMDTDVRVLLTRAPAPGSLDGPASDSLEQLTEIGKKLDELPAASLNEDAVAFLCSTSGTTGDKKLARVAHSSMIAMIRQIGGFSRIARDKVDITSSVLPLSHAYGIMLVNACVYSGDTVIVHEKVDLKVFLSIQTFRVTKLFTIPSMVAAFVDTPFLFKMIDLSSLNALGVGSSALSGDIMAKWHKLHPKCKVLVGYGLTECGPISATLPDDILPDSCGVLLPEYEARLVRPDGTEVDGYGESGELYVRSPSIVAGYLGEEEAESTAFQDGWLRTGDVAMFRRSASGNAHVCIVDRVRDMIKVKGLQIAPRDIEECLSRHEGVREAAVVAMPDTMSGERAKAFVVPVKRLRGERAQHELLASIDRHVETHMTEPHWLKGRIAFVDGFARNVAGKVLKRELRVM